MPSYAHRPPKRNTTIRISEEARQILKTLADKLGISQTAVMEISLRKLHQQETQTMNNSAHTICRYCGTEFNARFGNHICNIDELETLIHQERTMTDEPDERNIAMWQERIKEVREFDRTHPSHMSGVSHQMPG